MNLSRILAAGALGMTALSWTMPSSADTAEAACEVRKGGDVKKGATGPCDFSQRQGYVRIDLRNGETFDLAPGNKADQFRDQKGNKVRRSFDGGAQVYQWEHRKIIVTFPPRYRSNDYRHEGRPGRDPTPHGQTPPDLTYLVNSRYVGGEVADEMARHGYRSVKDEVSGQDVYSYYTGHGNCVTVRLDRSRHVRSIVAGPDLDCRN